MVTEVTRGPNFDESDDYTNDKLNHEFETLLSELEPRYLREFFGCETKKRDLTCFNCLDQRTSWCDQDWEFAQKQKGGLNASGVITGIPMRDIKNWQIRMRRNLKNSGKNGGHVLPPNPNRMQVLLTTKWPYRIPVAGKATSRSHNCCLPIAPSIDATVAQVSRLCHCDAFLSRAPGHP